MTTESLPNQPVSALDLDRYAGTWHEIAHLPMYFQRKCKDHITATYTLRTDGNIGVRNACRTKAGKEDVALGIAKSAGGPAGALKVRFAPGWLSWLPWVWADYWVIELDPDYQWAVVGSPSRKYLWVLSRKPTMSRDRFQQLVAHAKQRGYPVDRLVMAAPLN
ncbi:MAG: lipocalin family protein [Gammaproteobacteria bacterium]